MISLIKIEFEESQEELKNILKHTVVIPSNNLLNIKGRFKNLENEEKFYLKYDADPLLAGIGICKLNESKNSSKTELELTVLPPILGLIVTVLAFTGIIYATYSLSIGNYGDPSFWPSILIPSGCLSILVLWWSYLGWLTGKKLKKNILSGIQITKNEIKSKE